MDIDDLDTMRAPMTRSGHGTSGTSTTLSDVRAAISASNGRVRPTAIAGSGVAMAT